MSSSNLVFRAVLSGLLLCASAAVAGETVDLASLQVMPQRGQSADQARRDRYECHNWAIEQTGIVPSAPRQEDLPEARAERVDRVITAAATGASLGGLLRALQSKNPAHGILAGAAIGAAVGAASGHARERSAREEERGEYLRALSACLEGRGYAIALPGEALVASASVVGR